ncbi:MAG: phasin family protein [Candidatus Competibacteraceae bacterium]
MTKTSNQPTKSDDLLDQVLDVMQKLRLAGLGAFSTVQRVGGQWLDTLIEEGKKLEARFNPMASRTATTAPPKKALTAQQMEQLEEIFQARVARALQHLQIPTRQDLDRLHRKMDDLEETIKALGREDDG